MLTMMTFDVAVMCLALNVYYEGATIEEPMEGLFAVAQVTYRRANGEWQDLCRVVSARKQFSWTINAVANTNNRGVMTLKSSWTPNYNSKAWRTSVGIARAVALKIVPVDYSRGATHYHRVDVFPTWSACGVKPVVSWGGHKFFDKVCRA